MRLLKEVRNLMNNYHVKSGMYHYYRAEYSQAVDFLRKALKDEDNLEEADRRSAKHYLTLALIDSAAKAEGQGEFEEGLEQLRRASEVSPSFPDIHFRIGNLLERMERPAEAADGYRAAVEVNENYVDARVALGFCLLRSGQSREAAKAFREALEIRKRQIEGPCLQGIDLLNKGDAEAAEDRFHEAFRAAPRLSQFYLGRAMEQLADEDQEKALVELDNAIEHNPAYPDLRNFRGVVLCELGRIDEAVEEFRKSASVKPGYLVPRLNLAFALLRAERYKEAEIELEEILEQDPSEPAARIKLAELRSGRPQEKRHPVSRGSGR